ncbi:hypothetical protein BD779DRAFT_1490405 [Infundibulicybe gibba]|nr:hypothetical protein BD779DRAFT_1490405 [Infundibulicybe gibba]
MPEGSDHRERSISGEFDDSDGESQAREGSNPPGKPGRKKNPNSQAARRDQNRIAQREFRLRKQQRIRDLEARVEILSGGKDEALGEMRRILKDLMSENQTLRNLLRNLATFIGDGAGGLLPKLGWEIGDFNRYQQRKKTQQPEAGSSKRQPDDDPSGGRAKKQRLDRESDRNRTAYPPLGPMQPPPGPVYNSTSRGHEGPGMFSDMMRNTSASPMFVQSSPMASSPQQFGTPGSNSYSNSFVPSVNMNIESNLTGNSFNSGRHREDEIEDDDPNKNEADKLIQYHLDNFKRNGAYCLPASLRPTLVQNSEGVIDRILHPELRDRMILLRTRYDLADCLMDYRLAVNIHGDDVLNHANWEIGEAWLRKYEFLVDQALLNVANRWRRERREQELHLSDLANTESITAPT